MEFDGKWEADKNLWNLTWWDPKQKPEPIKFEGVPGRILWLAASGQLDLKAPPCTLKKRGATYTGTETDPYKQTEEYMKKLQQMNKKP